MKIPQVREEESKPLRVISGEFFNALDFLIPFVLAAWELDNDGAYLSPLKKQISKQVSFYPCSPIYLAGSNVKKASWGILVLFFRKPKNMGKF